MTIISTASTMNSNMNSGTCIVRDICFLPTVPIIEIWQIATNYEISQRYSAASIIPQRISSYQKLILTLKPCHNNYHQGTPHTSITIYIILKIVNANVDTPQLRITSISSDAISRMLHWVWVRLDNHKDLFNAFILWFLWFIRQ